MAAAVLPEPGAPAMTNRPELRPPNTVCSSRTRPPARRRCSPIRAYPGTAGNPVVRADAPGGVNTGAKLQCTAIESVCSRPCSPAARVHWAQTVSASRVCARTSSTSGSSSVSRRRTNGTAATNSVRTATTSCQYVDWSARPGAR